jgi:CheY-like chemotaxis protein
LEAAEIGVLFTDIRLPGPMDGWRLAEKARALKPDLPVIYATGFSAEAPRLVPDGVLLKKPYTPSTVIETIERLAAARTG